MFYNETHCLNRPPFWCIDFFEFLKCFDFMQLRKEPPVKPGPLGVNNLGIEGAKQIEVLPLISTVYGMVKW